MATHLYINFDGTIESKYCLGSSSTHERLSPINNRVLLPLNFDSFMYKYLFMAMKEPEFILNSHGLLITIRSPVSVSYEANYITKSTRI